LIFPARGAPGRSKVFGGAINFHPWGEEKEDNTISKIVLRLLFTLFFTWGGRNHVDVFQASFTRIRDVVARGKIWTGTIFPVFSEADWPFRHDFA
jgi:hypothetical protein